jgi:hypothetical protein
MDLVYRHSLNGRSSSNSKSEIEIFGKVVPLNKICDIAVAVT